MVFKKYERTQKTKYYLSNFEKTVDSTGKNTRSLHFISSPDGLCAIYVKNTISGNVSSDSMFYVNTDHLGSIALITTRDNSGNGIIIDERSYDAWGRARNPLDWTANNVPAFKVTERGFTGHEHLLQFGLINMNGRMYDPLLGRMLSPDNYVMSGGMTQAYNRYSYALNNPLKYTDPNGEFIPLLAIVAYAAIYGGVQGDIYANNHGATGWNRLGYIAGGAAIGAASGYLGGIISAAGFVGSSTASLIASSTINSAGWTALSGGETDFDVNFGFGSYNFTKGDFSSFGSGNWFDNLNYGIGALTNLSDIVNLRASIKTNNRSSEQSSKLKEEDLIERHGPAHYGKYGGSNGLTDPELRRAAGVEPIDANDKLFYKHDNYYYGRGADGAIDAFLNSNIIQGDIDLINGLQAAQNSPFLATGTHFSPATAFNLFSGIVGLKETSTNSFLIQLTIQRK